MMSCAGQVITGASAGIGRAFAESPQCGVWLVLAAGVYILSQLVGRRVFAGVLPNEQLIQDPLEETLESLGHLMLYLGILLTPLRPRSSPA